MSKARQLAQRTNQAGRKNLLINGAMTIAQRGTSEGPSSLNGVLALDRWYVNSSGGTKTISQQTFTVGQTDVPGFPKNYVRLEVTTGDNNTGIHQRVEDVTSIAEKTVTLSFWAKGTNPTGGSFVSSWIQNFGSGGSSNVETEAKSGIVLTSSWQKFTITFTVPSVVGKTIGAGSYTWVELLRQPATDTGTGAWTADIALAQLEVGSTATEFEHRSFGEELVLCQRYYHQQERTSNPIAGVYIGIGQAVSTTQILSIYKLPQTMRVIPTLSLGGDASVGYGDSTGSDISTSQTVSAFYADNAHFSFYLNSTGVTQFDVCRVFLINNTSIKFDAEL